MCCFANMTFNNSHLGMLKCLKGTLSPWIFFWGQLGERGQGQGHGGSSPCFLPFWRRVCACWERTLWKHAVSWFNHKSKNWK